MSDSIPIATNESISFYPKHIDILNKIAKKQNIKTKSATVQYIVETYNKTQSNLKRDTVLYVCVPIMFFILSFYIFLNLQKLEDILFLKKLFFAELTTLKNIFFVITLGIISGIATSIYLFYHKSKQQG